jgi:outer membrane protein
MVLVLGLCGHTGTAMAETAPLSLAEALATAQAHQPRLRQAVADTAASRAAADRVKAALLPQVSVSSGYQFGPSRQNVNQLNVDVTNLGTYAVSLGGEQLLYDFGQSSARFQAALAQGTAQEQTGRLTAMDVRLRVRTAFLTARANQALVGVAREALDNRHTHQRRIRSLVELGLRAPIDLVQASKDVSNARLSLINAENADRTAKTQLNLAMGIERSSDFAVVDETMAPVAGEEADIRQLTQEAIAQRPDIAALTAQIHAQRLTAEVADHAGLPGLKASVGAGTNGSPTSKPSVNWNAGLGLSWPLYAGGEGQAQAMQAQATLASLQAQAEVLRHQLRATIEQTQLGVGAAKAAVAVAAESTQTARTQLRLAEARYAAGLGSVLELGTAQLAYTDARAQEVQENLKLATARAQLLMALGRE